MTQDYKDASVNPSVDAKRSDGELLGVEQTSKDSITELHIELRQIRDENSELKRQLEAHGQYRRKLAFVTAGHLEQQKKIEFLGQELKRHRNRASKLESELSGFKQLLASYRLRLGTTLVEGFSSIGGFARFPSRLSALLFEGVKKTSRGFVGRTMPFTFAFRPEELERVLRSIFEKGGSDALEAWSLEALKRGVIDPQYLNRITFDLLRTVDLERAVPFAERALQANPENTKLLVFLRRLSDLELENGNFHLALLIEGVLAKFENEAILYFVCC